MPPLISIFTLDVICPFCWVGHHFLRLRAERWGLALRCEGFELHPETPAAGLDLSERAGWTRSLADRIERLAADLGLSLPPRRTLPQRLPNSRLAHRWALAMEEAGVTRDRSYPALMDAYFTEGCDIGDSGALGRLSGSLGADPSRILDRLAVGDDAGFLRMQEDSLDRMGMAALPHLSIEGFPVIGVQNDDCYEKLLPKIRRRIDPRTAEARSE